LSSAFRQAKVTTYARAIAWHMGKYIPGNPSIIGENMAAAAPSIAAKLKQLLLPK